jgi:outer membrane protein assembly factor BamE (lipoprotein component of BamABCDE complex)
MLLPRLSLLLTLLFSCATLQAQELKKAFKFSTFYAAVNGGNSVSDQTIYSVTDGLTQETIATPFDYSLSMGVRKIALTLRSSATSFHTV